MATDRAARQYVVLPLRGLRAVTRSSTPETRSFLRSFHDAPAARSAPRGPQARVQLLDAINEEGAKLIEATPESLNALREQQPDLRIVPVVYFRRQWLQPRRAVTRAETRAAARLRLTVVSAKDGSPVAGAYVSAFTDYANDVGVYGTTNASGVVSLPLNPAGARLDRLYVYPKVNFWGLLRRNVTVSPGTPIKLRPLDLSSADSLRHFYGDAPDTAGLGVRVAVVDDGIDLTHPDLRVSGGLNTVRGEEPSDFGDAGGHGTHVAGIIAARGRPPGGIRGLAPAVELRSYRVFGQGSEEASSFAIAKAIDRAVADRCDLINLSISGADPDPVTRAAMEDALARGCLVIVAAGNQYRSPVGFPASASPPAIAVSAMGRKGTFPPGTTQAGEVAAPYGRDKKNFVAAFSNFGIEIDLTAPGLGVVSTFPGGYAPMDGTSMACPAVTGYAARLLSGLTDLLNLPRDAARSSEMAKALFRKARPLGFGATFEGQGMPR